MNAATAALLDTFDEAPRQKRRVWPRRQRCRQIDLTNHFAWCDYHCMRSGYWRRLLKFIVRFYPQDAFSAREIAPAIGCHPTTVRRVADQIVEATGGGLKVSYQRTRDGWTLRFRLRDCEAPPEREPAPEKPSVSEGCCEFADKGEATFGSSSGYANTKKKEPAQRHRSDRPTKPEDQVFEHQEGATAIARCARQHDPEPVQQPDPPPQPEDPPASKPHRDSASLRKFRRDCWLQKLMQYASEPSERRRVIELTMAEGPLDPIDQKFLDDLDKRMHIDERAGRFKAGIIARFRRRRRAGDPSMARRPEDRQAIRELLVGKHLRCMIANNWSEASIAEYMDAVGPWVAGEGDVAAAKEAIEKIDHWMRRVRGWDDMRKWKAANPDELGKVRPPGQGPDPYFRQAGSGRAA